MSAMWSRSTARHSAVLLLGVVAVALVGLALPAARAVEPARQPVRARPAASARPLLIKHGWDIPTPAFVRAHLRQMERMPFDGVVIRLPSPLGSDAIQRKKPVSLAALRAALAPLRGIDASRLRHSFLIVYATAEVGYFDPAFDVVARNFAALARAAHEVGLEGIVYDNENYFGGDSDHPGACAGRSVAACRAQAQRRGRQVMQAVSSAWPAARLLVLRGPYISDPATARHFAGVIPWNDIAWANRVSGSFFVGLVEGARRPASVIDGGELFTIRSRKQFLRAYDWQKRGLATKSSLVASPLKKSYGNKVSVGFGVYDTPVLGLPMNASIWRSTISNALETSDRYVWAYSETYDWWGGGYPSRRVPQAWVTATKDALRHAGNARATSGN